MDQDNDSTFSDEKPQETSPDFSHKNIKNKAFFIPFFLVLALIMGFAGGFGTIVLISSNQTLRNKLGLENIGIGSTQTQRIVLEESSAVIDATKKVSPAVVSIISKTDIADFFGRVYQQEGGGSGFIITNDGLILTNKHVVSDTKAEYTVFTSDGKDYPAKVVSTDPSMDLAVVKIEASGLPVVELGDSDKLQIGEWAIAIGNALAEFQNTVTVGVISAKDRKITASGGGTSEELTGLLQTDAAINSGNSGGPLVNLKGQVVGINTAVAGNAQNIGFAITINSAKKAIDSIKKTGRIIRPMIGIRYVNITKELAKVNSLSVNHGALVYRGSNTGEPAVVSGGPADKAGVKENDIIVAVNGEEIDENHSLNQIIQNYDVGDEVELTISRDAKEIQIKLTLAELK